MLLIICLEVVVVGFTSGVEGRDFSPGSSLLGLLQYRSRNRTRFCSLIITLQNRAR